ncbi:MAG: glycosyltransferase family 39 protein, partial [Candidatus Zixiibacteriota bacterium]
WLVTVWFAMRFLEVLGIRNKFLSIVVFCVVCLLPAYTFLSSAINNDNLLLALSAILLFSIARPHFTDNSGLVTGVLLGLAVLTKLTAVIVCFAYALILLVEAVRQPDRRRIVFRHFITAGSTATLLVMPWVIRNVIIYHSITAEYVANVPREWPSYLIALYHVLKGMLFTFWSVSGIHNNVRSLFPAVGCLLTIVAGLGLILTIRSGGRIKEVIPGDRQRWFFIAMAIAFLINVVLVARFGFLYAQGQGRFLYPLLLPEALFLAIGLRFYRLRNLDIHTAGLFLTYCIGFTFYSLVAFRS